jgi:F-type H+-transporting ATPase subunit gamma
VYSVTELAKSQYLSKEGEKEVIVVITSDKGLAGSLNSAVLKLIDAHTKGKIPENIIALCLGKKGYEHCLRKGFNVAHHSLQIKDEISMEDLAQVGEKAVEAYKRKDVGSLSVIFQNFVSTFAQEPAVRQLLPIKREVISEMIKGIIPKTGKFSDTELDSKPLAYTLEPDSETVFDVLVPQLVFILLYHALLETKASEHSARMVAMKNASDNAKEVSKRLTLQFNKARQAAITREVSEITGGMEAMAQK